MVKFTEELLKETKGMGHPGQESARLAGGTGRPSEEPGARFFSPLTLSLLTRGFLSSLARSQNLITTKHQIMDIEQSLSCKLQNH